jgi:predicted nucleic acid-binding Zn ribbon protein
MPRTAINWGIVVALALVITVLQVFFGSVTTILMLGIRVLILVALGYLLFTLWRNNRARLQYLERRQKLLFYGAGALIVLVVLGSFLPLGWSFFSAILFFAIIGGCAFVMWRIWRDSEDWY